MNFVSFGPAALEGDGGVDDRHGIAQPAAEALHFTNNLDVLVPVDSRGYCPHNFPLIKDIDIVVDNDREFQVGHLDEGLHARLVRFVLEFLLDRDIGDAAPGARGRKMDGFDSGDVLFDDVIDASFLGYAAEVPVIHMARPEVFNDAVYSVGDRGYLDDRYLHLHLIVTQDFTKRILRIAYTGWNLSFNNNFGIRRDEELIAPSGRRGEPQGFVQKRRG